MAKQPMIIQSPFFNKMNFDEYLKKRRLENDLGIALSSRKIMSVEEKNIYKKKYEEFIDNHTLYPSNGLKGFVLKCDSQLETPYKFYINPGLYTFDFAEMIINRCEEKRLKDYNIKFIHPKEMLMNPAEMLVLYGTYETMVELYYLLNELIQKNNYIEFGKPPILADNIDGKIGFGYDEKHSFSFLIPDTIKIAVREFRHIIKNEIPKEYIKNQENSGKIYIRLNDLLNDYPKYREKFQKHLNKAYIEKIKKIPGIEQFIILEEWYLNDNREYKLKTFQNGSIKEYTSEEAIKLFGLIPPNFEWVLNKDGEYQLREILIDKNGYKSKRGYSLDQAIKKFGLTPPDYKYYKDDQKLPIERNVKK